MRTLPWKLTTKPRVLDALRLAGFEYQDGTDEDKRRGLRGGRNPLHPFPGYTLTLPKGSEGFKRLVREVAPQAPLGMRERKPRSSSRVAHALVAKKLNGLNKAWAIKSEQSGSACGTCAVGGRLPCCAASRGHAGAAAPHLLRLQPFLLTKSIRGAELGASEEACQGAPGMQQEASSLQLARKRPLGHRGQAVLHQAYHAMETILGTPMPERSYSLVSRPQARRACGGSKSTANAGSPGGRKGGPPAGVSVEYTGEASLKIDEGSQ